MRLLHPPGFRPSNKASLGRGFLAAEDRCADSTIKLIVRCERIFTETQELDEQTVI